MLYANDARWTISHCKLLLKLCISFWRYLIFKKSKWTERYFRSSVRKCDLFTVTEIVIVRKCQKFCIVNGSMVQRLQLAIGTTTLMWFKRRDKIQVELCMLEVTYLLRWQFYLRALRTELIKKQSGRSFQLLLRYKDNYEDDHCNKSWTKKLQIVACSDTAFTTRNACATKLESLTFLGKYFSRATILSYPNYNQRCVVQSAISNEAYAYSICIVTVFMIKHGLEYIVYYKVQNTMPTNDESSLKLILWSTTTSERWVLINA